MKQVNTVVKYGIRRVTITLTAMLCAIPELLDTTIVNVALNDLQGNLGATLSQRTKTPQTGRHFLLIHMDKFIIIGIAA